MLKRQSDFQKRVGMIYMLVAGGKSYREVAKRLKISESTVSYHMNKKYRLEGK